MNKISNLLNKTFLDCPLEEQLEIKQLGRPMPDLDIEKRQNISCKERTRKFNRSIYSKNNWLCGCDEKQALFCFPCLLFGGEATWTETGVTDLVHIWEKIRIHEKSRMHMYNTFSLYILGKSDGLTQLNSTYRQTVTAHNEQVDKNRYVLDIIIDCIRFCGALELALRGHDDNEEFHDWEVFRDLIDFSSHLDRTVKEQFTKSSAFKGAFKTIQDELLECVLDVYQEEVTKEIKKTDYVAVIVNGIADICNKFQLVIILRYVVDGKPVERFWNFVNPASHDAGSVADSILKEIDPLISDTPNKLIAQSYDGANGNLEGVQERIKGKYPLANYIHYYANQIEVIMSGAASVNRSVQIFYAHLSGICSFFSTSPERIQFLDETVKKRSQCPLDIKWNFHSDGVNTIYEYRKDLICVMETLQNSENIRLNSVIEKCGAYIFRLNDPDFVFWLAVFHKIIPYVDIIFNQLQEKNIDSMKVKQYLQNFENSIQNIYHQMDEIVAYVDFELSEGEFRYKKKARLLTFENKKTEALQICDSIVQQVRTRFSFTGHLVVTNLFAVQNFTQWRKKFPESLLEEVVHAYPFLEKNRLKSELQVLYNRDELNAISGGATALLSLILPDEISDIFHEMLKLLKVLVTIPMSTSETERCFPMLRSIKTFLKNTMKEQRLGALGMLSVEKAFLNNIENFNKRVIELFANKSARKMDFQYRTV